MSPRRSASAPRTSPLQPRRRRPGCHTPGKRPFADVVCLPAPCRHSIRHLSVGGRATRQWRAAGFRAAPNLEGEPAGLCGRMGVGDTSWPSRRRCAMVRGRVRAVSDPSRRRPCADGHVLLQTTSTPLSPSLTLERHVAGGGL